MKTAVVVDQLTGYGGAEKVALVLAEVFNADVWTTTYIAGDTFKNSRFLKFILIRQSRFSYTID